MFSKKNFAAISFGNVNYAKFSIRMASRVKGEGCRILTAMTTVVSAEREKCGEMFQVPISSDNVVVKGE
ncbi:hypothetical protein CMI38_01595 [Candidatus Pacearchaeota archaeon]|jgi:hypothetical protein|nr:hypothetical protein [Candidatus Pacearchaeota archaeon]|tara:strand:- start:3143 stop:3349 length:207 start_codon:yes stop_codon:yes gene_type:complete